MGWHTVTDYQCSVCHDPCKTYCIACTANLCTDCGYPMKKSSIDMKNLKKLLVDNSIICDDESENSNDEIENSELKNTEKKDEITKYLETKPKILDFCEECFDEMFNVCSACSKSVKDPLIKCECYENVCKNCAGEKLCWSCVQKNDEFMKFLIGKLDCTSISELIREFETKTKK